MTGLIPLALLLAPIPAAADDAGLPAAARALVEAKSRQAEARAAGYAALAARDHVPRVWSDRAAGAARDLARLADRLAAGRTPGTPARSAASAPTRPGTETAGRRVGALLARHRERLTRRAGRAADAAAAWGERTRRLTALLPAGAATAAERDAAAAAAAVARAEAAFARARLRIADDAAAAPVSAPVSGIFGAAPGGGEADLLVGSAEIRLAALALAARAAAARDAAAAASDLGSRLRPLGAEGAASPGEVAAAERTAEAARFAADADAAAAAVLGRLALAGGTGRLLVPLPRGLSPLNRLGR